MFQKMKAGFFLRLVLIFFAGTIVAIAAERAGDGKDHPLLSKMPGYHIHEKISREFDAVALKYFEVEGTIAGVDFPVSYEGKLTRFEYRDEKKATSNFAVFRNYDVAILSLGGRQVNTGFPRSSEGVTGNHHVFEIPHQNGAPTVILLKITDPGQYHLTIIEPTALPKDVKVGGIAREIGTTGTAKLYLNFDENKAELKDDGADVVAQVAVLMAGDSTLKLAIEGHTDNVGSEDSNRKLSTDRAQSVMRAVVAKGIAPNRLSAKGFGAEKAAADNSTDEGRARNRRVELVRVK